MNRLLILPILALPFAPIALAQPVPMAPLMPHGASAPAANEKPKPLYDTSADTKQQIAAALAGAKKNNRRVLLQWGGNWCPWCLRMGALMKSNKTLSHELLYEYDVVHVDCGQPTGKNLDLAETYGAKVKQDGFPYLTILDDSGKPLANHETSSFELKDSNGESILGDKSGHDPKKLLAFLKKYQATPVEAQTLYDHALADAKSSHKVVFLHFGAPWCGWCHRLETWMARPDVAPLLAKDFIDAKIDQDRNPGGDEMLQTLSHKNAGGIPWYAFIDAGGKPLATSTDGKQNIGFPGEPEEIVAFEAMLKKAARNLTPADINTLIASLKADKSTASTPH